MSFSLSYTMDFWHKTFSCNCFRVRVYMRDILILLDMQFKVNLSVISYLISNCFHFRYGLDSSDIFWIGLLYNTGVWTWEDGSEMTYDNFAAGYPITNQPCVALGPAGEWENSWCTGGYKYPYICEISGTICGLQEVI